MTLNWSKWPFIIGLLYAGAIFAIAHFFELRLSIPWQPISIIGIAVAFYLGFKNNSSYDRTWEARKIWGSIVNNSRSFAAAVVAFVQGDEAKVVQKELVYRHIAWMTALRHQLRLSRPWEHVGERLNRLYLPTVCENYSKKLGGELAYFLNESDLQKIEGKSNLATQIMRLQSERLQALKDEGYFEDFRHMELHQLVVSFYEDQGKSERIKNFPFPRQYASTALWLTLLFCIFVPLGILDIFRDASASWTYWLSPLISGLIIWIFFLMEKIGDYSENPFEGTYNDVPITSIARGIEIDLREMIDDTDIPKPIKDDKGFLM
jgi:putative membrane protein